MVLKQTIKGKFNAWPWCWEGLKAGGEGDDRAWDSWMASSIQWAWAWVNSRRCWRTGKHGMLQSMGSWRVGHKWPTTILLNNLKSVILKKANDHFLWPSLKLLLLLLRRFSHVRLCVTPETAAHQAPPSLGFSRQEHWSGLLFPSPMCESEVTQSCTTLSDPMDCSLPGYSILGIFQAGVLEWGAIAFSILKTSSAKLFFW